MSTLRELRTRIKQPRRVRPGTKKLSQNDVATIVGVSNMTVWKWENGRAVPHPDCQPLYAKILGVTEAELTRAIEATLTHGRPDSAAPPDTWTEIVLIKTPRPASHPDADYWKVGTLLSVRGDEGRIEFESYYHPCGFEILEEKLYEPEEQPATRLGQDLQTAASHQSRS